MPKVNLLDSKSFCKARSIHKATLYRWIKRGEVDWVTFPGKKKKWFILRSEREHNNRDKIE